MGKINIEDLEKYTNTKNENTNKDDDRIKFFSLKNPEETAQVRFCHTDMSDIETITLHTTTSKDGKIRKVACLREYNDPIETCPFCKYASENPNNKNISPLQIKLFVSLAEYTESTNGVTYEKKIWERGPQFKEKLNSYLKRYNPLYKQVFEIEKQAKYAEYPIPGTPEEFPLVKSDLINKSVLGTIVATKTAEEMNYFIENGTFAKVEKREEPKPSTQTTLADEIKPTTEEDFFNGVSRRRL